MRQLFVSVFTLLLTAAIAFGFDAQTKAEIDELITFVRTSDVRFIRNGSEYSAAEGADQLRDKLARAGDRVKTTDDFITGIASKSYLSGKPYLVKFADGHTQPTGDWLRAHLAEIYGRANGERRFVRFGPRIRDPNRGSLKPPPQRYCHAMPKTLKSWSRCAL